MRTRLCGHFVFLLNALYTHRYSFGIFPAGVLAMSAKRDREGIEQGVRSRDRARDVRSRKSSLVAEYHGSIVAEYESIAISRDGDCLKEELIPLRACA